MIGMKLLVNSGKSKDIVKITKVNYTNEKDKYQIDALSLCTNKKVTLVMTTQQVKQSLMM